ncbi:MAG: hypothetical protein K6F51_12685 [Acetatifactor sp.]|nr:hypothetical protein [Acetatifactor sp.]
MDHKRVKRAVAGIDSIDDDIDSRRYGRMDDILSIPYDYSGYDLVFEEGTTDPGIYSEITELITNHQFDVTGMEEYVALTEDSTEDTFFEFYDAWIERLTEEGFLTELNCSVDVTAFVVAVNGILNGIGSPNVLDVLATINRYRSEVSKYSFQGKPVGEDFKYDVLEANVVAAELRKIGYELIAFFNGSDNDVKAILPMDKIQVMQELEGRIK